MPRLSEQHDAAVRRAIRDAMAIDPLISMRSLHEAIGKRLGHTVDIRYMMKLVKKVSGERAVRIDKEKVEVRIASMREDFRLARESLLQVTYAPLTKTTDKISAWRAIGVLAKLLLDAEMDLGIFDRKNGSDDQAFRYAPVPPEIFENIRKTLEVWRFPTDLGRKISPERFVDVEATVSPPPAPAAAAVPGNAPKPTTNEPQPTKQLVHIAADPEFRVSP